MNFKIESGDGLLVEEIEPELLRQSETIRLMTAQPAFKEGVEKRLRFPTIDKTCLEVILKYMRRHYVRGTVDGPDCCGTVEELSEHGVHMHAKQVLQLLLASHYLQVSGLTTQLGRNVATNLTAYLPEFEQIQLPDELLAIVGSHINNAWGLVQLQRLYGSQQHGVHVDWRRMWHRIGRIQQQRDSLASGLGQGLDTLAPPFIYSGQLQQQQSSNWNGVVPVEAVGGFGCTCSQCAQHRHRIFETAIEETIRSVPGRGAAYRSPTLSQQFSAFGSCLRRVRLRNSSLSDKDVFAIVRACCNEPLLQQLDVSRNLYSTAIIEEVVCTIASSRVPRSVTHLHLASCNIDEVFLRALLLHPTAPSSTSTRGHDQRSRSNSHAASSSTSAPSMSSRAASSRTRTGTNQIHPCTSNSSRSSRSSSSTSRYNLLLDLSRNDLGRGIAPALVAHSDVFDRKLFVSLDFSANPLSLTAIHTLSRAVKTQLPNLLHLACNHCSIALPALGLLFEAVGGARLAHLSVEYNITAGGTRENSIGGSIQRLLQNRCLTHLGLSGNQLWTEDWVRFARQLQQQQQQHSAVHSLRLNEIRFGEQALERLARCLQGRDWTYLSLRHCFPSANDLFLPLCTGLSKVKSLRSLDLSDNELPLPHVAGLTKAIACCHASLLHLHLDGTPRTNASAMITDASLTVLLRGVLKCRQLQVLSLAHNEITSVGVDLLVRFVHLQKQSLKLLDLRDNPISDRGMGKLETAVEEVGTDLFVVLDSRLSSHDTTAEL